MRPARPSAAPPLRLFRRLEPSRVCLVGALLVATFAVGACGEKDCTADTPAPSRVRVVDRNGAPVLDARVARRVPGAADRFFACITAGPSEGCEARPVYLPSGASTLVASRADGSSEVEMTVTIVNSGTDDCPNQVPQQITMVLAP